MARAGASAVDTREQIVRIALRMIRTRSYLGFSFQDIADEVGIRKASLYHHFASKEQLGVEVMGRAADGFKTWTGKMSGPPEKKLAAYVKMFRETLQAGRGVCPAGALAPGWDCIDPELQKAVQVLRDVQIAWLSSVLTELAATPKQARQRAGHLFAVCQGALLSSRMTGDVADFDDAVALAQSGLRF